MNSLPDSMQAWRLHTWRRPPELVEVELPRPSGEEVLLRVDAVGLCRSDLHMMEASPGDMPFSLPFTLGHEVVGTVVATGDRSEGVTGRHAVHGVWACGDCRRCVGKRENYCLKLRGAIGCGIGRDGGLAEYLLVPSPRVLVPAAEGDPVQVAPLTDGGLTAFHALHPLRDDLPGSVVVVIGVGGVGHLALQLLVWWGASTVIAVDPRPDARDLAQRVGATHALGSVEELAAILGELGGADVVVDLVGTTETLTAGPRRLAPGGQAVLVGSAGGGLTLAKGGGLPRGWGVKAPFWGTRSELVEVIQLAERGALQADVDAYALPDAMVAYERLRAGQVGGRAVVVPTR